MLLTASGPGIMTKVVISYILRLIHLRSPIICGSGDRTRSQRTYVCSHVEESQQQQISLGMPTSAHAITEDLVQRLYTGPALSPPTASPPRLLVLSC